MDKTLVKNITILSGLTGVVLAFFSLIPVVVKVAVFILMLCVCLPIIIYLRRIGQFEIFTVKESIMVGALCGLVSYIAYSVVFLPLVYFISLFFPITYLGGLVLMLKLGNFPLVLMFTIFISTVCIIFNAFSSLLYYYVTSGFQTIGTDKKFKLK